MGRMRPGGATRRDAPGPAGAPAWDWRLALGLALGALLALAGPAQADLLIEGATTDPQGGAWTSPAGSTHGPRWAFSKETKVCRASKQVET